jgi:transcriptional regulator with XRE-family HTH domain
MRTDRVEREEIVLRLKARRIARRMTQETIGRQIGTPKQQVGKWERGEASPLLGALIRWARALDMRITVGDAS